MGCADTGAVCATDSARLLEALECVHPLAIDFQVPARRADVAVVEDFRTKFGAIPLPETESRLRDGGRETGD